MQRRSGVLHLLPPELLRRSGCFNALVSPRTESPDEANVSLAVSAHKDSLMLDARSPSLNVRNDSGPSFFTISHIPNKKKHQYRIKISQVQPARFVLNPALRKPSLCLVVSIWVLTYFILYHSIVERYTPNGVSYFLNLPFPSIRPVLLASRPVESLSKLLPSLILILRRKIDSRVL